MNFSVIYLKLIFKEFPLWHSGQWVKNMTAVAWVTAEAQVGALAWGSGLKGPALPQMWRRSQLLLGFNAWNGNFHMLPMRPLKKKKVN